MTIMVVTCKKCRAWYNMDMEYGLSDYHWDMRTGQECINTADDGWEIRVVSDRDDWEVAY